MEVKGDKEIIKMRNGVGLDVQDLRDAMSEVGDHAKKYFGGQVFASRGGVLGATWPRLSPNYAVQKARRYPGRPVLVRTGLNAAELHVEAVEHERRDKQRRAVSNCQDLWIGVSRDVLLTS